MSIFGRMIKRGVTKIATESFDIVKDVKDYAKESYERAKRDERGADLKRYDEMMSHYTEEEQNRMKAMSKNFAMVDIAKKQAKGRNEYAYLDSKYKEIDSKRREAIENKN